MVIQYETGNTVQRKIKQGKRMLWVEEPEIETYNGIVRNPVFLARFLMFEGAGGIPHTIPYSSLIGTDNTDFNMIIRANTGKTLMPSG